MAFPKELANRINAMNPADSIARHSDQRSVVERQFLARRSMQERAEHIFNRGVVLGCTALALAGGLLSGDQAPLTAQECPEGMVAYTAVDHTAELSDAARAILEQSGPEVAGAINWTTQGEADIQPLPDCVYPA